MIRNRFLAFLLTAALTLSVAAPAYAIGEADSDAPVTYADLAAYGVENSASNAAVNLGQALRMLFQTAGMDNSQLGSDSDCVALADSLGMLNKDEHDADETFTAAFLSKLVASEGYKALVDALKDGSAHEPLFVNGMAQPVFPFTTGAVKEGYSNDTSDIIRYCVYVETNYDTDGDGKLDLVKALVQVPRAAAKGDYKAATIYEARPYITGCTDLYGYEDGLYNTGNFDIKAMYKTPAARTPADSATTEEAAAAANSADWYYWNPEEKMMDYEDLDWYNYYLVRGYAVVECGGLGTKGSEGYETCGTDLEIDAFKCVIEWLHGDRVAYTDKTSNISIAADWSNGKVGMTGRSYAGTTQFGLATTGVDGLETIVPVAGIASWYEYTNSQGISTDSEPAYSDALAGYCAGRKLDADDWNKIKADYGNYLQTIYDIQRDLNGNYGETGGHWNIRDYTVDTTQTGPIGTTGPSQINCSALIVHGLNDYNVRTKEFQLMYNAFTEADKTVKILLHQDGHLTPTYPAGNLVFDIGEDSYDEILNRWFSHYLYGVENGAENMAAVTAQDSHDTKTWNTYASWKTEDSMTFSASEEGTTTINSDYSAIGVTPRNWQSKFTSGSTGGSVMYAQTVENDTTIKGTVAVNFSALADNMPDAADGDQPIGERDALMVSAMLVDIAPEGETFPAFNTAGSYVPKAESIVGGAWMGSGLDNYDKTMLLPSNVTYKIISRGWMDLCNPGAGFDSHTAATRVTLDGETYLDYTIYLQSTVYEVEAGHTLALVIYAHEPGMSSYYTYDENWNMLPNPDFQNYQITVDNNSVNAEIPVANDLIETETIKDKLYTVSYSSTAGGSIKSKTSSKSTAMDGAEITLTATADSGYSFDHWTVNGAEAGKDAQLIVTITDDTQIVAVFTKNRSSSGSSSSRTYSVTVEDSQNGTVTASPKRAEKGDTVSVTASANSGYAVSGVTVKTAGGDTVKVADNGNGKYTFTMPAANVTVTAAFSKTQTTVSFADVSSDSYCADAVKWAVENGVTNGTTAAAFSPNAACTRGQIVTFLWCAAGSPAPKTTVNPFTDVAADAYYAKAVLWAVENGITNGTTATTFSPDAPCTRAQAVTFLFRGAIANGLEAVTLQELISGFSDAASLPGYAVSAMNWALANGIVQGNGGALMPNNTCTRGQIVTFLYRASK
ncbi:CocE/NonD family hydrolase [uncultured Dysosmobacter sp.]|uniref:CocE/NonD family hydrolase n=1 Tax=uncultured Dysosmobacter sp. TaxID=2591384 RepID=UPI0026723E45|nr:CocE/NonD family hydrolase [uncultured Dysosmobacter sp.]